MDLPRREFTVFVCFAQEDQDWYESLDKHLSLLKEQEGIALWSDQQISAGMEREEAVARQRQTADLFPLLVSSHFLNSQECHDTTKSALQREREGTAVVLPILLRPVDWQGASFSHLQMLPRNHVPVTSWANADEAFEEIAREIRAIIEAMRRWVVLSCSPHHRSMLTQLADVLETQRIPVSAHDDRTKLSDAIRLSSAVILLTSLETCFSLMDKETVELAIIHRQPVIVLWLPDEERNEPAPQQWRGNTCIDARPERYDDALKALLVQLKCRFSISPPRVEKDADHEPRNPYKGLLPFGMSDVGDFFGRETLIKECLGVLQQALRMDALEQSPGRLLAIIGPSGSGKSSMVMAGLLPNLHKGVIPGSEGWVYLGTLVPGTDPIEALTIALSEYFPEKGLKTIREDLKEDSTRGLHQYAVVLSRRQDPSKTQVVLVVDQFEELFTQTVSEENRRLFLDLLITAITVPHGPLLLILTLRVDFSDRVLLYSDLSRLIDAHHCLVLPMETADLRRVIEQPATLSDVALRFEENLVSDLLLEMRGQIGALPLLQFTLDQLFEKRDGHLLTAFAYHELGEVKGALAKHAETTFTALPTEKHRKLAQLIFLRLVVPGDTEQDTTRRRASLSEFEFDDALQTRLLQETMEAFIAARLLMTNDVAAVTTVEVSHEAVIREWKRFADWVHEARKDISLQRDISKDVAEWEQRGKPKDRLYRGSQLKEAKAWATRSMPSRNEVAFLRASAAQRVRLIASVIVVALLLLSTTGIAVWVRLTLPPNPTVVTTLKDTGPGSLRQAVAAAKPGDMITFDPSLRGTIILTNEDLNITKSLDIHGPGTGILSISSANNNLRVYVSQDASVTISGIAFKDSQATGICLITNGGTLTLTDTIITGNMTFPGGKITPAGEISCLGGGIENSGMLTLTNSRVTSNTGPSGGIYNSGTLTLIDSIVSDNSASGSGNSGTYSGGGIYNGGTLTLINSTVSGNSADGSGGGIWNGRDTRRLPHLAESTLTLTNSTVSGNSATGDGGGIYNGGTLTITDSTVSGNSATSDGGGISNGRDGIINNIPTGGMLTLVNSTIADNTATHDGGGITFGGTHASITFCTIYGNKAAHDGGSISLQDFNFRNNVTQSRVEIRNSIVASDPTRPGPDIAGMLTSYGYNLFQDNSGASFDPATGTQHGTDKTLSTNDLSRLFTDPMKLQNNGGSTQTLALAKGSPALDQIPVVFCHINGVTADQRGIKRPDENEPACDIGAYEQAS